MGLCDKGKGFHTNSVAKELRGREQEAERGGKSFVAGVARPIVALCPWSTRKKTRSRFDIITVWKRNDAKPAGEIKSGKQGLLTPYFGVSFVVQRGEDSPKVQSRSEKKREINSSLREDLKRGGSRQSIWGLTPFRGRLQSSRGGGIRKLDVWGRQGRNGQEMIKSRPRWLLFHVVITKKEGAEGMARP